ncbi:uncharacterized protein BXZ73DRAFT_88507 [Epithele typhae]|uniref:uncharacterized protein n=1 Tax=Epithele typhae TaxID=378194 RepID=UPI002007E199|nr:uncharacterized protein BXZ73DRAFT_88507 [Epithele typhae]KAH9940787.1 hypothetical protein BXZ73DRAFT_88507 [Epithele typhae]
MAAATETSLCIERLEWPQSSLTFVDMVLCAQRAGGNQRLGRWTFLGHNLSRAVNVQQQWGLNISTDDEIELKRARGEISCAECRRLKLKCDKKIPCGSCVRRGCTSICPNGPRLAIFQAGISHERHPLLRDELLSVKFGAEVRRTVDDEHTRDMLAANIDALGTLSLGNMENGIDALIEKLEEQLPPQPQQLSWWSRPIKRDELIDDILVPIYRCKNDPTKNSYYREGSRRMMAEALIYSPLSSSYSPRARRGGNVLPPGPRGALPPPHLRVPRARDGAGADHHGRIAQSVNRDSAAWKLEKKHVQRRRNLFWELSGMDMMHCMALGRPPALSQIYVPTPGDDSGLEGYWPFRHQFIHDIYFNVMDGMLAAKAPSYAQVLEFDRQIRQTTLPNVRLYLRPDEANYKNPSVVCAMIHIHRTFFAQALLDHPTNPLASPYAPSFLAANRCASILLRSFLHHWNRWYLSCSRFWSMWTHAFSAAVILGSTVTRSPNATMAPSALTDLELAVDFFEHGAQHSLRARQALPILQNLRQRALTAFNEYRNRHLSPSLDIQLHIGPEDQFTDELAIFGGQTRVMTNKLLSRRRHKTLAKPRSASSDQSTPPSGTTPSTTSTPAPQSRRRHEPDGRAHGGVHPSLMEYLSLFPSTASISLVQNQNQNPGASPGHAYGHRRPDRHTRLPLRLADVALQRGLAQALPSPPSAAASQQMQAMDALRWLDTLPPGPGGIPDVNAAFFSGVAGPPGIGVHQAGGGNGPACVRMDAGASQGIFDGSMVSEGLAGDQWTSLMRETGFFPVGDAQSFRGDGFSADMFPQY